MSRRPNIWEIPWSRITEGLPAAQLVPELRRLNDSAASETPGVRAVVSAPPGSGKTTVVPPLLADLVQGSAQGSVQGSAQESGLGSVHGVGPAAGRVVVTQPRRMAARAAARRLAALSGVQLGVEVGYTVRGDRRVSAATRVEFVTTGVLLRRLITDPEATGIAAVVLDEVHERHLDTDLTFALVQQLAQLRPELHVVVMSATLDAERWAELLGGASVLHASTTTHPLEERWAPWGAGDRRPLDDRGVAPGFLDHVADVVVQNQSGQTSQPGQTDQPGQQGRPGQPSPQQDALAAGTGDAGGDTLVFLPGAREIDRVAARLRDAHGLRPGTEIQTLLGSMPAAEQDRVLSPSPIPRIVLATNVAESALTVPGVRLVVDAGLDRQSREDSRRGVTGLVTLGASKSAMVQRGGRAAREDPGTVVRCVSEAEYAARPAHTAPQIRTAGVGELSRALLDVACWGAPRGAGLSLPDPFPTASADRALQRLRELGAIDDDGAPTPLGSQLARLPVDPHLGRALIDGAELLTPQAAAEVVAVLASDARSPGADLVALHRQLRSDRAWRHEVERLRRAVDPADPVDPVSPAPADREALGLVTALAFPHQIARRRPGGTETEFLLASGTAARLPASSSLVGATWLAVAELSLHGETALIRSAAELDPDHAELAAGPLLVAETVARFEAAGSASGASGRRRVTARQVRRLGAIELSSTPVPAQREHTRAAVVAELRDAGALSLIDRAPNTVASLRNRMGFLHRVIGAPWPDVSDTALTAALEDWLGPEIDRLADGASEQSLDLHSALRRLLPWPEAARFEELAPVRLAVPSGSEVTLTWPVPEDHDDEVAPPVLAVKLQECFGWTASPTVAEGRVPVLLHLLSPARRPLAVTSDLASFWENAYPAVRAENRARYAKHPWPEDPLSAVATARTNSALRRIPPG